MKIFKKDGVYIQKNDLAYLTRLDEPIPASIYLKAFGGPCIIINDSNRYDFICFTEQDEIDFFQRQDWIIDYDAVKDLTDDDFVELGRGIAKEQEEAAEKYNSMSDEEKKKNQDIVGYCDLLEFKFYSLRDILWYKQGHLKMTLPGEKQTKEPKKQGFIKRLFRKNS